MVGMQIFFIEWVYITLLWTWIVITAFLEQGAVGAQQALQPLPSWWGEKQFWSGKDSCRECHLKNVSGPSLCTCVSTVSGLTHPVEMGVQRPGPESQRFLGLHLLTGNQALWQRQSLICVNLWLKLLFYCPQCTNFTDKLLWETTSLGLVRQTALALASGLIQRSSIFVRGMSRGKC